MRSRRGAWAGVGAVAATLLVAALPPPSVAAAPSADVTIVLAATEDSGRVKYHFSCQPPQGNIRNPAKACAALVAEPSLLGELPAQAPTCRSPFAPGITVFGYLNGKAFRIHEAGGCWSHQAAALFEKLVAVPDAAPHRDVTLTAGQRRSYTAAAMQAVPSVRLSCRTDGSGTMIDLPLPVSWPSLVTAVHRRASLTVRVADDGAVTASCSRATFEVTTLVAGQQATFTAGEMQSVARVFRCLSRGSSVEVGSRVGQVIPPPDALYPRVRRSGHAFLRVTRDEGSAVTASCT